MSRIILKALLNINIYPYDNYVLIMLADNYQQKPHSSEVTKLVGLQQVKTLFQNNKEKGPTKRWNGIVTHHLPAVSTQFLMSYTPCYDAQGIENTMLIEKLYNCGTPHCEMRQYEQF